MNIVQNSNTKDFWSLCDQMVMKQSIIIDRPKGSCHPKYPDLIYPLDYGYLQNTTSMDHGGIDIWVGSSSEKIVVGCIITVDSIKNDSEIKILYACTENEILQALRVHNRSPFMKGILIKR